MVSKREESFARESEAKSVHIQQPPMRATRERERERERREREREREFKREREQIFPAAVLLSSHPTDLRIRPAL